MIPILYKKFCSTSLKMIPSIIPIFLLKSHYGNPPASEVSIKRLKKFKHGISQGEPQECLICKDMFSPEDFINEMPCLHKFHTDCLVPWLKQVIFSFFLQLYSIIHVQLADMSYPQKITFERKYFDLMFFSKFFQYFSYLLVFLSFYSRRLQNTLRLKKLTQSKSVKRLRIYFRWRKSKLTRYCWSSLCYAQSLSKSELTQQFQVVSRLILIQREIVNFFFISNRTRIGHSQRSYGSQWHKIWSCVWLCW